MQQDQIAQVQKSFRDIAPMSATVSDIFYERLFDLAPDTRALFSDEIGPQRTKFFQTLAVAVTGLGQLEALVPAVQDLGRRHAGYRVEERHYAVAKEALLFALSTCLGRDFTPDLREAWAATYDLLAGVMIGAQRAAG